MKLLIQSALLMSTVMLAGCSMMTDNASFNQAVPAVNVYQETTPQSVPPATSYQFPASRVSTGNKTVIIDPNKHIWGAYDANGVRVAQGPVSMDKSAYPACWTPAGTFTVYRKGSSCASSATPAGGTMMPYCLFLREGYTIYAPDRVPGYNANNSCVRLYPNDAKWLDKKFMTIGTRVQVLP